jgi:hypothetical protein
MLIPFALTLVGSFATQDLALTKRRYRPCCVIIGETYDAAAQVWAMTLRGPYPFPDDEQLPRLANVFSLA